MKTSLLMVFFGALACNLIYVAFPDGNWEKFADRTFFQGSVLAIVAGLEWWANR